MIKNYFIYFVLISISTSVFCQTKEVIHANFKVILAEAATDFNKIKGVVVESDEIQKTNYYASTITLGGKLEAICLNYGDNTTYFSSKFDYRKTPELIKATEILPGILDIVNDMIKTGKYKGRDYKNGDKEISEIKDTEGDYILEIESKSTDKDDKNYLMITVFGKSWGNK
jgi:hypothetical protein